MDPMDWRHWLKGLLAALINGTASGVILIAADPSTFNFDTGFKKLAWVSTLLGLQGAANYLKKSPLPGMVTSILVPLLLVCGLSAGCATAPAMPPNLTPQAQVAWQNMTIEKDLDLARDIVHDGNAQGVFSDDTTRTITLWHKAAILALHTRGEGWLAQLVDGTKALTAVNSTIPPGQRALLKPYLDLVLKALGGAQ